LRRLELRIRLGWSDVAGTGCGTIVSMDSAPERLAEQSPVPTGGDAVEYTSSLTGIGAEHLVGFFEGWSVPPSAQRHLEILAGSSEVILAVRGGRVVGFVTAVTDGVLAAYIPLLEVRREERGRGIGSALASKMLERLRSFYMVDVVCDADLLPFYERLGMTAYTGAIRRNRSALS
jgi:ribosomal protein S18 acetylase RimI-like enzyme